MFFPHKFIVSFCLILFCFYRSIYANRDLEEFVQDFVIQTKKITIPEYPHAFNASIAKWKGRWLMSFRCMKDNKKTFQLSSVGESAGESDLGLIWLDDEFNPVGNPQFVTLDHPAKKRPHLLTEDARLIVKDEILYVIYSANKENDLTNGSFRVYVAKLDNINEFLYVAHNECLSNFEGAHPNKREKNWVPFIYENELLLAHHLFPHKIFQPLLDGSGDCKMVSNTFPSFIWEWGELRGGTPAIKINEEYYLSFFHSSIPLKTIHSDSQLIPHYFMGAYLFSATPPFTIKYISPEPIIGPNFYHGPIYEPHWHPVRVIFPCGLVVDKNEILIMYGRQDHEIWITRIDKQQLLEGLIHVSTFPCQ
jgi:predicted GH43/DUF377 family glycosyl hydrolase